MTWPDVVSDAIKIGVPAGVAIVLVLVNRTTELKKDARRRRQDALEKILAEFEDVHADLVKLLAFTGAAADAMTEKLRKDKNLLLVRLVDDRGKLAGLVGRLKLLRLGAASNAMQVYEDRAIAITVEIDVETPDPIIIVLKKAYAEIQKSRSDIHRLLSDAFHSSSDL
jgi:hypothetical protein